MEHRSSSVNSQVLQSLHRLGVVHAGYWKTGKWDLCLPSTAVWRMKRYIDHKLSHAMHRSVERPTSRRLFWSRVDDRGLDACFQDEAATFEQVDTCAREHIMEQIQLADIVDHSYDAIGVIEQLSRCVDPKDALGDIFRVLQKHGSLCITDIEFIESRERTAVDSSVVQLQKDWGIRSPWDQVKSSLTDTLEEAGFEVIEITDCTSNVRPLLDVIGCLALIISTIATWCDFQYLPPCIQLIGSIWYLRENWRYKVILAKKP